MTNLNTQQKLEAQLRTFNSKSIRLNNDMDRASGKLASRLYREWRTLKDQIFAIQDKLNELKEMQIYIEEEIANA